MVSKSKEGEVVFSLSGKWVSWAHTAVAYCAFLGALVTGLYLHYEKIVQNEYYVGKAPRTSGSRLITFTSGIPTGMVPFSLSDNRRSISRTLCLPIVHSPDFRTPLRPCLPLLYSHSAPKHCITQIRRGHWHLSNSYMRRLDVRHIH